MLETHKCENTSDISHLVGNIQSGDLVFFIGTFLTSIVTQIADGGYCHVGMAHRVGSDVYVMHSVNGNTVDKDDQTFAGVQMTNLSLIWKVQKYTTIKIMRLNLSLSQYDICKRVFYEWYGRPYDRNPVASWLFSRYPQESINCIQLMVLMLSSANIGKPNMRLSSLFKLGTLVYRCDKEVQSQSVREFCSYQRGRDASPEEVAKSKLIVKKWLLQ